MRPVRNVEARACGGNRAGQTGAGCEGGSSCSTPPPLLRRLLITEQGSDEGGAGTKPTPVKAGEFNEHPALIADMKKAQRGASLSLQSQGRGAASEEMTMIPALTDEERAFATEVAALTLLPPGGERVRDEVAVVFGITIDDLLSESRVARLVDARAVIAYILHKRGWTFEQSGTLINRTTSTTQHLVERIDKSLNLRRLVDGIAA